MKTLQQWVAEDRAIDEQARSRTLALMEHRWRAINEGGYAVAEYATALGKRKQTIQRFVNGYALWLDWEGSSTTADRTPLDAYALASMSETQRAAVETVAEAKGIGAQTVERHYAPEVARARETIERAPDVETGRARARERVQRTENMRKRQRDVEADKRRSLPRSYLQVEYELNRARRALENAIGWARGADGFDDECVELLQDSLGKVRSLMELLTVAIVSESEVDWDAELAKINGEATT